MNIEKNYTYYRNKRIPIWWADYLPKERNPYKNTDTLTLTKGCLAAYWHIHSSNKHPNYRGAAACNFVHELIRERFGGAFLTSEFLYCGGTKGEQIYREPTNLVYENAYIGEDEKIHIKNANKYYEDVIQFTMNVLSEIAKNHMQSGNSYDASEFFPYATDREIEVNRMEAEINRLNTIKLKEALAAYMRGDGFCLSSFACSSASFNASYGYEDGWFNETFAFENMQTNIDSDTDKVEIIVDFPNMHYGDREKKHRNMATKELQIQYCFYLKRVASKDAYSVMLPIPADKVSDTLKTIIDELCNTAMEKYNETHIEMIETANVKPTWRYYPYNIFLDNKIGKLKLNYKEGAGMNTWRGRWLR